MSDPTLEAGGACRRVRPRSAAPSPVRPNRSSSSCARDEGVPLRRRPGPDPAPPARLGSRSLMT